jgi:hypothetical protein
MVTVTKSKKVIFERFDQPERIFIKDITGLGNAGELVGVEFMSQQ